ncbi:MAG: site-specific DNA-methyltransferase [Paludibacteraceae bacterium]|nr:site-specific DNA-methyltransferase [Paludibacteraceae bacterium]MBQ8713798.1 site-specific DNA-methyltransferase [Prevotella sp.]
MQIPHLNKQTVDGTQLNLDALYQICPSCFTETAGENGQLKHVVNFEKLRELLGDNAVEDAPEVYDFTWVGKRAAQREAMAPCRKTLRPCPEESVDWDNTQNLYIEGDNLEVLKLLQNSYMGKVKMIYIDPPYNTGNDFVYHDDFHRTQQEEDEAAGVINEDGERMVKNTTSNGKFHSDWCSMIYSRLMVARSLLTDDGVIFISIDDNEVKNLQSICNEVFGESNFLGIITWSKKRKGSFLSKGIISLTEYLLVYTKNRDSCIGLFGGVADGNESQPIIKRTNRVSILSIPANIIETKLSDGLYKAGRYGDAVNPVNLLDDVKVVNGKIVNPFRIEAPFTWSQPMFDDQLSKGAKFVINTMNFQIRVFRIYEDDNFKGFGSFINGVQIRGTNEDAYEELERFFGVKKLFDYSKPTNYIKELVNAATHFDKNSIILDFFSGSGTTAQSVMQLNAEDKGSRRFIMVQLQEEVEGNEEYKTICEIAKERIRRAGKKIKEEHPEAKDLDTGFRVFKCESSNYKDVAFAPKDYNQAQLDLFEDNIKEDRTDLDLLFDCMLRWGVTLDLPMTKTKVDGCTIHNVNEGGLVACFDGKVTEQVINAIAEMYPVRVVFRDSNFEEAAQKMNLFELFKQECGWTEQEVRNNVRVI